MENTLNDTALNGLEAFLNLLKNDVLNSMQAMGKAADAQTIDQMAVTKTSTGFQLELPGFLQILETGRAPTGKNAQTSNPPMIDRIKEWCLEKGIPEKQAWAIKKSIDKNGFKGKPGLLSNPLSAENIKHRVDPVLDQLASIIGMQITVSL